MGKWLMLRASLYPRLLLACIVVLLCHTSAHAQNTFRGILINNLDSSVIPYAAVYAKEAAQSVLTNDKGEFVFTLPAHTRTVTLTISAIGCKATVVYKKPFHEVEKVYLDITANMLDEVAVKALSAEQVVKIAIASIPDNYADSSYFDYSWYRRYQKVNNRYTNLCEAAPVVMFRLSRKDKRLLCDEAFAVTQLRRSTFHPDIMNVQEDNPVDLLRENPVLHLGAGPLNPAKATQYLFSFDTTARSADYVIRFVCRNYSADKHGIADYDYLDLKGEAWETGQLIIERGSFAIKKIVRNSIRYKDYQYKFFPPQNNLVRYSGRTYFFEFTGGNLEAEYTLHHGKWRISRLFRQYGHEFYTPEFTTKDSDISDYFEWYSDSVSRYTSKEYVDKFYPKMATAIFTYDTAYWHSAVFPYPCHYADKSEVYRHLEYMDGPLETQFYKESQVDEYARKIRKP